MSSLKIKSAGLGPGSFGSEACPQCSCLVSGLSLNTQFSLHPGTWGCLSGLSRLNGLYGDNAQKWKLLYIFRVWGFWPSQRHKFMSGSVSQTTYPTCACVATGHNVYTGARTKLADKILDSFLNSQTSQETSLAVSQIRLTPTCVSKYLLLPKGKGPQRQHP